MGVLVDEAVLKIMIDLQSEIKQIKNDIASINYCLKNLRVEQDNFMSAFPHGIDDHRLSHRKKKWLFF